MQEYSRQFAREYPPELRREPGLIESTETVENIDKEAIKARVIDVKITWVSNYRCRITKSSNRTPVIGHPHDRASIT